MRSVNRNGARSSRKNTPANSSCPGPKRYRTRLQTKKQTNGTQPDGAQVVSTQVVSTQVVRTRVVSTQVVNTQVVSTKVVSTQVVSTQIVSTQANRIVLPECQPSTSTGTWTCPPATSNMKSSAKAKKKSSAGANMKPSARAKTRSSTRTEAKPGRKSRRRKQVESDTDSVSEPEAKFHDLDYFDYLLENKNSDSDTETVEPVVPVGVIDPSDPFFVKDYDELSEKVPGVPLSVFLKYQSQSPSVEATPSPVPTEVNCKYTIEPDEVTIGSDISEEIEARKRVPLPEIVNQWLRKMDS